MADDKKIFMTGGSGFLGRSLKRRLTADGHEVTAISSADADLTRQDSLLKYKDEKFDELFHLAAWTQAGDFCVHHPGEQWLINQQINTTVLRWWADHQPQAKIISIGTSCSYPVAAALREENYFNGEPYKDLYTYAMTKRMLLAGQRALAKQFGLKYLTVVPSTLYGPDYHKGEKQLHFIFDLIRKVLEFKHFKKEIVLWGDGHQRREVVYMDDFLDALLALNGLLENDLINIGAGHDHSIREFAEMICEIAGVDPAAVKYDTSKYVGAKSKILLNDKIDKLLPNRKRTPLKEGLEKTIAWMEENYIKAGSAG